MGYPAEAEQRIQHRHQAIIPTYKFTCCGNITEWGVDLNPVDEGTTFNFDFQVWRPSSTVKYTNGHGCYSLVGHYAVSSISIETRVTSDHVAQVTPVSQLQFQPGDVLGFYVESQTSDSHENNGVVVLDDEMYTRERVWHARITSTTSLSGSCPYSVGRGGVLNTLTRAAPVISISTSVYSCPQSLSTVVSVTPTSTFNSPRQSSFTTVQRSATPESNSCLQTTVHFTSSEFVTSRPVASSFYVPTTTCCPSTLPTALHENYLNNVPLIAGAIIAFVVVFMSLIMTIAVAITVVRKRRANKAARSPQVRNARLIILDTRKKMEINPFYKPAENWTNTIMTVENDHTYEQVQTEKDMVEVATNPAYGLART